MSPQQQMVKEEVLKPLVKKRKKQAKIEFSPEKVFDPGQSKEEELELDPEMGRYKAKHGEGGDRRKGK